MSGLVRSRVGRTAGRQLADPGRERRLVFAGDRAVGQRAALEVAADRRVQAVEADGGSGRARRTPAAACIARRIAVCIGTEKPAACAHSGAPASRGSTDSPGSGTSCPARRSAAAGEATCSGWWPSS